MQYILLIPNIQSGCNSAHVRKWNKALHLFSHVTEELETWWQWQTEKLRMLTSEN
jgi:hypothetical protein